MLSPSAKTDPKVCMRAGRSLLNFSLFSCLFSFLPFFPPLSSFTAVRSGSFFTFLCTFRLGTNFFFSALVVAAAAAALVAPRVRSRLPCVTISNKSETDQQHLA